MDMLKSVSKFLVAIVAVAVMPVMVAAQESQSMTLQDAINGYESVTNGHVGLPYDWSHHHLIFSRPAPNSSHYWKVTDDSRYWQQEVRRLQPQGAEADRFMTIALKQTTKPTKTPIKKDWSINLGVGATMGLNGYASKWSFSTTSASCANDFVAFNTGPSGTAFGTVTINSTSLNNSTITVGTITYTFVTALGSTANQILIGSDTGSTGQNETAASLEAAINANSSQCVSGPPCFSNGTEANSAVTATVFTNTVTLTATTQGSTGNFALTASSSNVATTLNTVAAGVNAPTIVGFTNLYSGCGGTVPTTNWAFNTGGTDVTSPVVSLDGTQLAYVQSVSGAAQLVLLKWAKNQGSITSPVKLTSVGAGSYRTCSAPCMATIPFNGSPNDNYSSPFVNYSGDTLYVGDEAGKLHKFTNIFLSGTPTEATSPWPITINANNSLTSPVYDSVSGNIFVIDFSGRLSYVKESGSTTGSCASGTAPCLGTPNVDLEVDTGSGSGEIAIVSPMVDSSSGRVFSFVLCARTIGDAGCGVQQSNDSPSEVVQTNTALGGVVREQIGGSSVFDKLYNGDFDANYYSGNYSSGHLYDCGNPRDDQARIIYNLTFNSSGVLTGSTAGPTITTANPANCSPLTEFEDGSLDQIFLGLNAGGNQTVSPACTGSCVYSFNITSPLTGSSKASAGIANSGGTSGIAIDNDASTPTGAAQIYYTNLSDTTCTTSGTTGGCAVQAAQSGL